MRVLLVFLVLVGLTAGTALFLEHRSVARQTQYDPLIQPVAARLGLDPMLVRALIWRESRFNPNVRGLNKERGLMQVTPGVAEEWAQVTKSPPIDLDALFVPETNIEIGSWYLARTLHRWQETDNPAAFALAEYNAGRSNALRWVDPDTPTSAAAFEEHITFPATRRYVDTLLQKYAEYQRGYFRPPWLAWWDRVTKRTDAPTFEPSSTHP